MQMVSMIDNDHSRIHATKTDTLQFSLRLYTESGHLVHVYLNYMSFTMFIDRISEE